MDTDLLLSKVVEVADTALEMSLWALVDFATRLDDAGATDRLVVHVRAMINSKRRLVVQGAVTVQLRQLFPHLLDWDCL